MSESVSRIENLVTSETVPVPIITLSDGAEIVFENYFVTDPSGLLTGVAAAAQMAAERVRGRRQ